MKLDDYQEESSSSFLFIGTQGTGKSIAAASFPGPIEFNDFEGKLLSLKEWYNLPKFKRFKDNININIIYDIEKFIDDRLYGYAEANSVPFKTIVVDSISNASRDIVNKMLAARKRISPSKDQKAGGDRAKIAPGGVILPSWDEFDAEDIILGGMLGYLTTIHKKHGVNVVCIAHPVTVQGPNGTVKVAKIVCKGHKAPQTVVNAFNEIYHFEKIKEGINVTDPHKLVALTQGGDYSRTAWPQLPRLIDFTDEPFYEVLMKKLEGGVEDDVTQSFSQPQKL